MAIEYPTTDDIVLVVPVGTRRSARVVLPEPAARWLYAQLASALGRPQPEPEPCTKPKRRVRLHRGQWRA
jgi:hypothetical protein